jgi:hypothetical protein
MRSPLVRADVSETTIFYRASKINKFGVGVERAGIISTKPSVVQSTAETLDIVICLTLIFSV